MKTLHHPPTRAALNLPGLCPVCGGTAARKVTCEGGAARETYRCPVDGEVEYASGAVASIRVSGHPLGVAATDVGTYASGFRPLAALAGA